MKPSKYRPTQLSGSVHFRFPAISHPNFGMTKVTGQFRRIQPNFFRLEVDPSIIDNLANRYYKLANKCGFRDHHFKRCSIKTIILTAVQCSLYWMPDVEIDSNEMDFMIRFCIWVWFLDDAIEEDWTNISGKPDITELRAVNEIYVGIFGGVKKFRNEAMTFPGFPEFGPMCVLAEDVVRVGKQILGKETYEKDVTIVTASLQKYFESNHWFTVNPVYGRFVICKNNCMHSAKNLW